MSRALLFIRLFAWFNLRHGYGHAVRALAVLLGIALGAAVFTSVRLSIKASVDALSKSMDLIAGRGDQVLIYPGGRLPEELVGLLLSEPAVAAASPLMTAYVQAVDRQAAPFLLIGIDPLLDRPLRSWRWRQAGNQAGQVWVDLLRRPYSVIVGESLARELDGSAGDLLRLGYAHRSVDFTLLGTLADQGLARAEGGRVAITDIASFQEFSGVMGRVDRIDLRWAAGTDPASVAGIKKKLPEGVIMAAPSEEKDRGRRMIQAYQLNLSVLSFISLFAGMFLVYSLAALNAASRRHELATLKALGASKRWVLALFLTEGLVFGILGWLLAIPAATVLLKHFLEGVSQSISTLYVRVAVDRLSLDGWEILLSFLVTVAICLLGAWQPARAAMRVAPKEAMSLAHQEQPAVSANRKAAGAALVCILASWPLSWLPGPAGVPLFGYVATALLFTGFTLLSPWAVDILGGRAGPALRRFAGIPAHLAGHFLRAGGSRASISLGALITAVALYVSLTVMIHSFRQTVDLWVHQTISGDLFLTNKMSDLNRYRDPLPADVVSGLERLQLPVDRVGFRRFSLHHGDLAYQLEGLELKPFFNHGEFLWIRGSPDQGRRALLDGRGVVVSEVFASRSGLKVGDIYQAQVRASRLKLPIVGVVRDYRTKGGVVFCDLSALSHVLGPVGLSGIRLFFRNPPPHPGAAVSRLQAKILETCGDRFDMIGGPELRNAILRIFDETFAVTTVLMLIALTVAALGMATTLGIVVLERSVQLNTLMAVGASRGQISAMILWESVMMVAAGSILGLGCGFILSYLIIFVVNLKSFGWTFIYGVDWASLALALPLNLGVALAAALPAVRLTLKRSPAVLLRQQ